MADPHKPFEGATHRAIATGEYVKAVCWKKDGDHKMVERYPVEKRELKGLLAVSAKEKYGLRFGDWILEDASGRLWVVEGQPRQVEQRTRVSADSETVKWVPAPSAFEAAYAPIGAADAPAAGSSGAAASSAAGVAPAIAAFIIGVLGLVFGDASQLPFVIGFGVTHLMYYSALLGQWNGLTNGVFDLDTDTVNVSAHTNTYTPNQDTHDFFDDVTNEVTGTNYSAGGAAIGSKTLTRSTTTVTFDGADVVWSQSGAGFSNARKFVIRRITGSAATERLFSVVTADGDVGNVTGDLTLAWSASGIATWSTT